VDDPGNITIRLSGTGPIAQPTGSPVDITQTQVVATIVGSQQPSILDPQITMQNSTRICGPNCLTRPDPPPLSQSKQ
jgi:hypothetical protein